MERNFILLYDMFDQYKTGLYVYTTRDNDTLCITIHSLKTENHKSLPAIVSMVSKIIPYTAEVC